MTLKWGFPHGIHEGSDFALEAVLTINGAKDSDLVTSSGTYTLSVQSSVLNAGTALLADEGSDSTVVIGSGTKVRWEITDTQSSGWEAGEYPGDVKLVDSGGSITYWSCTMKVRTAID